MKSFNKQEFKNAIIGMGVLAIYMLSSIFQTIPLELLGIDYETLNVTFKIIYALMFQVLLIVAVAAIYRKTLKKAFNNLKDNHKNYFQKYFRYWILMVAIMIVSNGIIKIITGQLQPANEEAIAEMFTSYPFYTFISATLLAPIMEELVFRQAFRGMFKTNWLYILTSALIFGGLHVVTGFESLTDLLYLIPYCTPGIIFAYIMIKTDNVFVPMAIHLFHNGITMALMILVNILELL